MRELEKKQALKWSSTRNTRQDIPFVRTARSGNWRSALSEGALEIVENNWGSLMQWLRYELVSDPKPNSMTAMFDAIVR